MSLRYTFGTRKQLHVHYVMQKNLFTLRYELKLSLKFKEQLSVDYKRKEAQPEGERNIMAAHPMTEN